MIKSITLNLHQRRMLIEAARSFRQADKDAIGCNYADASGNLICKATLKEWDVIIRKLRARKRRKK